MKLYKTLNKIDKFIDFHNGDLLMLKLLQTNLL